MGLYQNSRLQKIIILIKYFIYLVKRCLNNETILKLKKKIDTKKYPYKYIQSDLVIFSFMYACCKIHLVKGFFL